MSPVLVNFICLFRMAQDHTLFHGKLMKKVGFGAIFYSSLSVFVVMSTARSQQKYLPPFMCSQHKIGNVCACTDYPHNFFPMYSKKPALHSPQYFVGLAMLLVFTCRYKV